MPHADLVLTGGKILTLDPRSRTVQALAVRGDRLAALGRDDEIAHLIGPDTRRIDLRGRLAVPGLFDGHAHMDREGLKLRWPSLAGARSIDDILQIVDGLVRRAAPGEWIVTMPIGEPPLYEGVPDTLAEKRWPTRHDLDRVAPDHPVYIRAIWGHWRNTLPLVSIANTRALARAGIDRDTRPPAPSIEIQRDARGEPTGVLIEHTYKPLVEHTLMAVAPRFTLEDRVAGLAESMRIYNRCGTTSVFEGHGISAEVLAAYQAVRERGRPSVRAHLLFSPAWPSADPAAVGDLLRGWGAWLARRGLGDEYLRVGGLYTESDYSEENRLRGTTSPYTGWASFSYKAALPEEVMVEMMIEAARSHVRVGSFTPNILDLYERVNRAVSTDRRRSSASGPSAWSSPATPAATSGRTAPCWRVSSGRRAPPASRPCARSAARASTSRSRPTTCRRRCSTRSTTRSPASPEARPRPSAQTSASRARRRSPAPRARGPTSPSRRTSKAPSRWASWPTSRCSTRTS